MALVLIIVGIIVALLVNTLIGLFLILLGAAALVWLGVYVRSDQWRSR